MSIKIRNKDVVNFFVVVFIFVSILFPADFYHMKVISFAFSIFFGAYQLMKQFANHKYMWVYLMGIAFPGIIIFQSVFVGSSFGDAFSGGYTAALFLLLILVLEYDIKYEKYLLIALRIIAYATVLIVFLDIIGIINANGCLIRDFLYKYKIALMGKSPAYSSYYKIFFKTSPLLLILLNYSIDKRDYFHIIISIVAMLFGTRANLFIMLLLVLYKLVNLHPRNKNERIIKIIMILMVIFGCIIAGQYIVDIVHRMMNTSGSKMSDAIRAGQIKGIVDVFKRPYQVLFGAGFGNDILYNYNTNQWVKDFEISYFALFAKIGIIWFSIFMIFVLVPIFKVKNKDYVIMYLGYLAICFTNPLLCSSTAFLMYIYMYRLWELEKIERKNLKLYSIKME